MKKKWSISLISALLLLVIGMYSLQYFYKKPFIPSTSQEDRSAYFVTVPIAHWTSEQFPAPCISVQIENQTISALLDLGFRGFFSISGSILDKIEDKRHVGSIKRYDFRGQEYIKEVYEISNIQIGRMRFSQIPVQKESEDFHENSSMSQGIANDALLEEGSIGWEICRVAGNLLLDLPNNTIAFCDSLNTLKEQGYAVESFTKTPLLTDRGLVELVGALDYGTLRCVLDTGSTWNCLPIAQTEGHSVGDMVNDPSNIFEMPKFRIENEELGPLAFHRVPINLPIKIDALLGMDFFQKHTVFISFTDQAIYLQSNIH